MYLFVNYTSDPDTFLSFLWAHPGSAFERYHVTAEIGSLDLCPLQFYYLFFAMITQSILCAHCPKPKTAPSIFSSLHSQHSPVK